MARYVSLDVSVFFVCKTAPRGELKSFAGLKIIPGMLRAAKVKPEFFQAFFLQQHNCDGYSVIHSFTCGSNVQISYISLSMEVKPTHMRAIDHNVAPE